MNRYLYIMGQYDIVLCIISLFDADMHHAAATCVLCWYTIFGVRSVQIGISGALSIITSVIRYVKHDDEYPTIKHVLEFY